MKNHLTEIQLKDIFSHGKASKKVSDSGWKRIPAISSMNMKLGEYNELLKKVDIKRRMPTKFQFTSNSNKELNKYMEHQIRRLERLRDEGKASKF